MPTPLLPHRKSPAVSEPLAPGADPLAHARDGIERPRRQFAQQCGTATERRCLVDQRLNRVGDFSTTPIVGDEKMDCLAMLIAELAGEHGGAAFVPKLGLMRR